MDFVGQMLSEYWHLLIEPDAVVWGVWGVCAIIALYVTSEAGLAGIWLELFEAEGFGIHRLVGLIAFVVTLVIAPVIAAGIILLYALAFIFLILGELVTLGGFSR